MFSWLSSEQYLNLLLLKMTPSKCVETFCYTISAIIGFYFSAKLDYFLYFLIFHRKQHDSYNAFKHGSRF